jgi:pteridine reductase
MSGPGGIKGRTVLVTGGALRLGRDISLALARAGANVVVHYRRSAEQARLVCGEIQALKVGAWPLAADFAKPGEAVGLVERAWVEAGRLDALVNSASEFLPSTLAGLEFQDLVDSLRVNAWAPFVLGREFARRAGQGGRIVNILDTRIDGSDTRHAAYILAKQMLGALTRMMAADLAPAVTVNAVAPGLILPPAGRTEDYLDALAETVPLKRHGSPDDVAGAVLYLLQADFVTGQVIHVDGGRHVRELSPRSNPD